MKLIYLLPLLAFTSPILAQQKALPAPLKLVTEQGGEIVSEFAAPANMKGDVADFKGEVISLYITADEQYLFTGPMLDANGNNIGEQAANDYATGPKAQKDWQTLESSHWIVDGSASAKRVVYTFTDPNCPYCRQFWQNARPWVDAGEVTNTPYFSGYFKSRQLRQSGGYYECKQP